jgi:hypothetical protein
VRADNPVHGVVRFADGRRERRLSDDEYRALGEALAKARAGGIWPAAVAAAHFLALTGWRSGEVLSLRWGEVDLARRTAILPDTKTGRSLRPLSSAACNVLRLLTTGEGLVFPATRGDGPMLGFPKLWARIAELGGMPGDVTPHTLRHSFASMAADLGYSEPTIGALIGHKGQSITSRYAHAADAVLLAAADAVADRTAELMGVQRATSIAVELHQFARRAIRAAERVRNPKRAAPDQIADPSGVLMGALPKPSPLFLQEAVAFIAERKQINMAEAQDTLLDELRRGTIVARGVLPLTLHPKPDVAWAHHPATTEESIHRGQWFQSVDWKLSRLGRFRDITIESHSLEARFPKSREGVRGTRRRPPHSEVEAAVRRYVDQEAGKSTSITRAWSYVKNELPKATKEQTIAALRKTEGGPKSRGRPRKKNPGN